MSDLMDSFRLDGKVALVTGATYGIGMAIAEALGEAGAKIAFNARHADKVAEAEKHYRKLGFDAHGYVADVTDEAVVAELIAKIEADFGTTPDILVNNAGVIQRTPMLDMSAEDFRRVVDIDLNAPFIVSKACLPGMIAKGHGKIINICSMMSELGRETIAGYAAGPATSPHRRPRRCARRSPTAAVTHLISSSLPRRRQPVGVRPRI